MTEGLKMQSNPRREAFEAAYCKAYPVTCQVTPDVFEIEGSVYTRTTVQVGWIMWQAGAQAERDRINAEKLRNRAPIIWAEYE